MVIKKNSTTNQHQPTRTIGKYENTSSRGSYGSWLNIFILLVAMFLTGLTHLSAQNSGYYVELRFVQRFSWTADEYAMRYEVVIEKNEAERYRRFLHDFTETNFIEVSLSPGKYRYQVIPHDFFDQPITVTDWVEFEVRPGDDRLTTGEHSLIIVNPGDEASRKEIILTAPETAAAPKAETITEHTRQFDIFLGAAYAPLLPVHGENQFFGENLSFVGFSARLCTVYAGESFLNPGIELTAAWRVYEGGEEQAVNSASFDFNLLAQSRFPGGKTALNFRAGAGLSLLPKTQSASPDGQYSVHANIGVSFLWLFRKNLYAEVGADYSQFFTEDYFGFFRPWIGMGCRF